LKNIGQRPRELYWLHAQGKDLSFLGFQNLKSWIQVKGELYRPGLDIPDTVLSFHGFQNLNSWMHFLFIEHTPPPK
jgi:hypothetical protein